MTTPSPCRMRFGLPILRKYVLLEYISSERLLSVPSGVKLLVGSSTFTRGYTSFMCSWHNL